MKLNYKFNKKCVSIILVTLFLLYLLVISKNKHDPDKNLVEHRAQQLSNSGARTYMENENKRSYSELTNDDIQKIRIIISNSSDAPEIINAEMYSPFSNNTVILIVQVHMRLKELSYFIDSLTKVKHISDVLLIFSHDVYDEQINNLVQAINFCKVLQIFYPYSIQTHPFEFPGTDPLDCPTKISKEKAKEIKCTNAEHPDKYGNFREASFTQTKHHWWWKANTIFDQLELTKDFTGYVFFLEEDHYLAEDAIHMINLMVNDEKFNNDQVNVLSLGSYTPSLGKINNLMNKVARTPWLSVHHNMGFGINRDTWVMIKKCSKEFCEYDDYNWDWSLQFVSDKCLPKRLTVLLPLYPRSYHIGKCGMHHTSNNCNPEMNVMKVLTTLNTISSQGLFYPESLELGNYVPKGYKLKLNGGWGDVRDRELCTSMVR